MVFTSSLWLESKPVSEALLEKSMDWAGLIQQARAGSDSALGIIVSKDVTCRWMKFVRQSLSYGFYLFLVVGKQACE